MNENTEAQRDRGNMGCLKNLREHRGIIFFAKIIKILNFLIHNMVLKSKS